MEPITTTDSLAQACARLAKHPCVTIDTEFLRESTYYPILCVMQMASPDEALVVDALAPDIDLAPFFALMADERVLKVFHAGRQDIEIVWHRAGRSARRRSPTRSPTSPICATSISRCRRISQSAGASSG